MFKDVYETDVGRLLKEVFCSFGTEEKRLHKCAQTWVKGERKESRAVASRRDAATPRRRARARARRGDEAGRRRGRGRAGRGPRGRRGDSHAGRIVARRIVVAPIVVVRTVGRARACVVGGDGRTGAGTVGVDVDVSRAVALHVLRAAGAVVQIDGPAAGVRGTLLACTKAHLNGARVARVGYRCHSKQEGEGSPRQGCHLWLVTKRRRCCRMNNG